MFDLIAALALLACAMVLLAYLGALLLRAAGPPLQRFAERRRIAHSLECGRFADRAMAAGDVPAAIVQIRRAFYLRPVTSTESAAAVANHHTGLLSRLLALTAEERTGGVRLLALAKVDRLLTERSALQRRFVAASRSPVRQRREVETRLRDNGAALARALDQLAAEVLAAQRAHGLH